MGEMLSEQAVRLDGQRNVWDCVRLPGLAPHRLVSGVRPSAIRDCMGPTSRHTSALLVRSENSVWLAPSGVKRTVWKISDVMAMTTPCPSLGCGAAPSHGTGLVPGGVGHWPTSGRRGRPFSTKGPTHARRMGLVRAWQGDSMRDKLLPNFCCCCCCGGAHRMPLLGPGTTNPPPA